MITVAKIICIITVVILANVLLQILFRNRQKKFLWQYGGNEDKIARNVKVKIQQRSWYDFFECDLVVNDECFFLLSRKKIFGITLYQGIHQLNNSRCSVERLVYVARKWNYDSLDVEKSLITIDGNASKQWNMALLFHHDFDVSEFLNKNGIISE